jgi:hypothetical protein
MKIVAVSKVAVRHRSAITLSRLLGIDLVVEQRRGRATILA